MRPLRTGGVGGSSRVMDWVQMDAAFSLLGKAGVILVFVANLFLMTRFVSRSRFEALERRVESTVAQSAFEELEKRVATCERKHDGTASGKELAELKLTISELNGTLGRLDERLKATSEKFDSLDQSVGRIENSMIHGGVR